MSKTLRGVVSAYIQHGIKVVCLGHVSVNVDQWIVFWCVQNICGIKQFTKTSRTFHKTTTLADGQQTQQRQTRTAFSNFVPRSNDTNKNDLRLYLLAHLY